MKGHSPCVVSIWILAAVVTGLPAVGSAQQPRDRPSADATASALAPFDSDADLSQYLRGVVTKHARWRAEVAERERIELIQRMRARSPLYCDPPKRQSGFRIVNRWLSKANTAPSLKVIKGRLMDLTGGPIGSGNIMLPNLGLGANTSAEGLYRIDIASRGGAFPTPDKIVARRIGYVALPAPIDLTGVDSLQIDFRQCMDMLRLDQTVIIGQGEFPDPYKRPLGSGDESGEGGQVKIHGDHLLILHRGRLVTVSLRGGELRPISSIAAVPPGVDPEDATQNEVFISGDKAVVVGINDKHGIEITVVDIDNDGSLRYRAAYHIRRHRDFQYKADYVARLAGNRLNLYSETDLPLDTAQTSLALPAIRKWDVDSTGSRFALLTSPQNVYRPARSLDPADLPVIHSLTSCDLSSVELVCTASVVVATRAWPTYDSGTAFYVWSGEPSSAVGGFGRHILYRLPFDGSHPAALELTGGALSEEAFLERDGYLNVLLRRASARTPPMPDQPPADLSLLRVPLTSFGRSAPVARASWYKALPSNTQVIVGPAYVDGVLSYGYGMPRDSDAGSILITSSLSQSDRKRHVVPHSVAAIVPTGTGAIAISQPGAKIHFTSFLPAPTTTYTLHGEPESTHEVTGASYSAGVSNSAITAFVVRSDNTTEFDELSDGTASVLFLKTTPRGIEPLGRIAANVPASVNDGCKSTCVDWYNNAKSVFVGDRILTVFGYEVVEAKLVGGKVVETRRIDVGPRN